MPLQNGAGQVHSVNPSPVYNTGSLPGANGIANVYAMMNATAWMKGLSGNPNANSYDSMMSYDESEWYQ